MSNLVNYVWQIFHRQRINWPYKSSRMNTCTFQVLPLRFNNTQINLTDTWRGCDVVLRKRVTYSDNRVITHRNIFIDVSVLRGLNWPIRDSLHWCVFRSFPELYREGNFDKASRIGNQIVTTLDLLSNELLCQENVSNTLRVYICQAIRSL